MASSSSGGFIVWPEQPSTSQSAFQPPEAAKCCYTLCDSGHGVNNNVFYFSFSSSQLWAARLKRIRTPTCVTSRRGRTTTLTGCCFGRTVRRTPAPTCCVVSLNESYLIKRGPRSSVATKPGFPPVLLCLTLYKLKKKKLRLPSEKPPRFMNQLFTRAPVSVSL